MEHVLLCLLSHLTCKPRIEQKVHISGELWEQFADSKLTISQPCGCYSTATFDAPLKVSSSAAFIKTTFIGKATR